MRAESTGNGACYQVATKPNGGESGRVGTRGREKHGHYRLKRAVNELGRRGLRAVDGRTAVGKALTRWRQQLVDDLGGEVSTQQAAVIELALRTRLLLDSIDGWLLRQKSLINHRRRALFPVVRERQTIADALARYLDMLGLQRRAAPIQTLDQYLSEQEPQP